MVTESRKQRSTAITTRGLRWPEDATEDARRVRINRQLVGRGYRAIHDWTATGAPLSAYINHSRWLADCSEDGCKGTEFVDSDWPRFVCIGCGSGVWPVSFPKNRLAIEATLLLRPKENRNWTPGESVADLRIENAGRLKGGLS